MPLFAESDLDKARRRTSEHPWASATFAAVRGRADAWLAHPASVPTLAGGWMHDYVCPEHWNALVFDPASPAAHRCLHGETRTGQKYDAAWRVLEHRRIASLARDLGLIYALTGEPAYSGAAWSILTEYAARYGRYAGADSAHRWMLKGRAFQQALTEALWAVPIAQAYSLVRRASGARAEHVAAELLRPMVETIATARDELVNRQGNLKSNYNAWLIAALGLLGYALDDPALVEGALDGPAGFRAHLAAAVLPDGFEYEGTPYYHNFVALAYTILAEAARANGRDLYAERGPDGQSIEAMWRALSSLAFADGSIPQINDGAYWHGGPLVPEICEIYEVALARTGDPEFAWLLGRNYAGGARDGWTALLFAERDVVDARMPPRAPVCLPSVGIAVLRNAADVQEVCVPFGPHAGSHSHLDRLGVAIHPYATDPGTPPYGVEAREGWFQQTAAHNAVVVDGGSQAPCAGELLTWDACSGSPTLRLGCDEAYAGVRMSRSVTLTQGKVHDTVLLTSATEHVYDWVMHLDGECSFEGLPLDEAGAGLESGAYRFFTGLARRGGVSHLRFTVQNTGSTFDVSLAADAPMEIFIGRCPATSSQPVRPRQAVIARVRARGATFTLTSEVAR